MTGDTRPQSINLDYRPKDCVADDASDTYALFSPLFLYLISPRSTLVHAVTLCISVCRLQKESRLPPTTVARRPLRGDVMASATLAPWLVMKTGDSLILRAPECPDETKHGTAAKRVPSFG